MMDPKRNEDTGELDIQALLDKYLPDDGASSKVDANDSIDPVIDPDGLYFVTEDKEKTGEFELTYSDDAKAEDAGEDEYGYNAYDEFSDAVDSDGDGKSGPQSAVQTADVPAEENKQTAADAILSLEDDELVLDENIISELMASDDAQFGGIEGFEDIEELNGFDITGASTRVDLDKVKASDSKDAEGEAESVDDDSEEFEPVPDGEDADDFVESTIDEIESETTDETDMDFIVAFGLEDELGKHVGANKATRLKKSYEKEVERREEIDRKSVQNEYKDVSQTKEITKQYKRAYSASKVKIFLTAIFALVLLVYENLPLIGYQLASFL
ncbi:MAG: hypothetical protein IKN38_10215, partial [Clostridia bacterium]|nr:hypothetical protein [Clostridia bacterium]